MNHLLALTISSHLSQKDKISKIANIYSDRNLKLVDFLAEMLLKNNAISLKNYFELAVNLKNINFVKMTNVVKGLRGVLDELNGGLKGNEVGGSLKQAILLSRNIEEELANIFES